MASESVYASQGNTSSGNVSNGPLDHQIEAEVPVHPFLTKPLLYISDLDSNLSDKELASNVFSACLPVRLHVDRSGVSDEGAIGATRLTGTVEFQTLQKAEKALATIQTPTLSINEDAEQDPKPNAKPRLIKQLPYGTEDSDVFDMFRPYGPLHRASRIVTNPLGHHTGFRGFALVVYYDEQHALLAQEEMHCAEVDGKSISVTIDNVARRPSGQATSFSPSAAPFVPGGSANSMMNADAPAFHPPRSSRGPSQSSASNVPGSNLQYSTSAATFVDPCNLFCKSLDPSIDSNELFSLFKGFGKIVSARVMRDPKGVSREFGFVSFRNPLDASRALAKMNGTQHGSKQMIVRLHEPKNLRQEKLSHKFGTSYVGPDSPSDAGEQGVDAVSSSDNALDARPRRLSNSYFRAAASGENDQMDVQQLQSMNATLRGDILRGGFSRKVKELPDVSAGEADQLVMELSRLHLTDAVGALNDAELLTQRIAEIRVLNTGNDPLQVSEGENGNGATSSTLAAPIDAISTLSASGPAGLKERERLLSAVKDLLPSGSPVEDIADLLVSLPKKERAMALFNQDYLRSKVEDARAILEMDDNDEDEPVANRAQSPDIDGHAANGQGKTYTLADLAKLSALEIVQLASNPQSVGLPLPKADTAVVTETDAFIDSIKDLPPQDQKQKLGDQLFKKIRSFGVKGAPKIVIALLDKEDLRSLAHLMNSYPECLRAKVALQAAAK